MPNPCIPIRKSRMASSVRKNALKIGPSSPKLCVQRCVPSRTASSRWPHMPYSAASEYRTYPRSECSLPE